MKKTILITGATDGIGLETAKKLVALGHTLLIHGRNQTKLSNVQTLLLRIRGASAIETYTADLSKLSQVEAMAHAVAGKHTSLDILINNAGVYKATNPITTNGMDLRFVVNAIAPYLLTKRLLPLMSVHSRVVNLSSAAQAPVNLRALAGAVRLSDGAAYSQSKLALIMWSMHVANHIGKHGASIIAVNPASFLATKMVKDAYGVVGKDMSIGADIIVRAALSAEFANASGRYFDNDQQKFARPHPDALVASKNQKLVQAIDAILDANKL